MQSLTVKPTIHTPMIDFSSDGKLIIEGRSLPEDVFLLYNPLVQFASKLLVQDVIFDINLDYFNTATSKALLEVLKSLEENSSIDNILVNWHYEENDEDSLEMGEIYEERLQRIKFKYLPHPEIIDVV